MKIELKTNNGSFILEIPQEIQEEKVRSAGELKNTSLEGLPFVVYKKKEQEEDACWAGVFSNGSAQIFIPKPKDVFFWLLVYSLVGWKWKDLLFISIIWRANSCLFTRNKRKRRSASLVLRFL